VYCIYGGAIISGHDHMANWCTHLDFGWFYNRRKIYAIPLIFIAQYVLAVMSHKSTITYINGFHREHQHFISVLILIGYYLSSLLYFIIPTPVTMQKLFLEYTGPQKFSMQSGNVTYQLQKVRQTQCKLYYGFLNIVGFIVIRIAMSIWHKKNILNKI